MMIAYFGFILLVAFAKPTAGTLPAGGRVRVGIVLRPGVDGLGHGGGTQHGGWSPGGPSPWGCSSRG